MPVRLGTLLLCAGTSTALADAVWIDPTGGNWGSSVNWQGNQFPSSSQVVYFDQRAGGTALTFTVNMNGSSFISQCKALFVQTNTVTLDFGPGSENLALLGNSPSSASLVVGHKNISGIDYAGSLKVMNSGAFDSDYLSGNDAAIGTGPGPAAAFIVRGGGRADFGPMTIGGNGAGTVSVENGGDLNGGTVTIATTPAGTGVLTVTDSGSTGDFGQINVGSGGAGTVNIAAGGDLTTSSLVIGLNAAGSGSLTVGGSGSTASTTTTTIGNGGTGTLTVNAAGSFTAGTLNVGQSAVGSGQLNISGSGATASTTGTATIGNGGTGNVSVSAGGAFNPTALTIGASPAGSGVVTVSGSGAGAAVTNATTVGSGGNGTFTVNSAGVFTSATMIVGAGAAGTGQATFSGAGTTGTMSGAATVGGGSTGILTVDQGAHLTCSSLTVGNNAAGSGTVTVSGTGSYYHGSLTVGAHGSVSVQGGASIQGVTTVSAGGVLTVDGAGSVWAPSGVLNLNGTGALIELKNGAACNGSNTGIYLGYAYNPSPTSPAQLKVGPGCVFNSPGLMLMSQVANLTAETGQISLNGGSCTIGSLMSWRQSSVTGNGTLSFGSGNIAGRVSPDGGAPNSYGTLTVHPATTSTVVKFSGPIELDVRGDDAGPHDALIVDGVMSLENSAIDVSRSASLIVRSAGSLPGGGNTMSLPLITASGFDAASPRFRAALLPGLPDNRFFRVTYPETGGTITLGVQSLFNSPEFGGSANSTLNATVTAADAGDLDDDGFDDLAVTTSDGFLFLLLGNGDGTFSQVVQLPVGNDPRGVVVADLDPSNPNNNGLDVVVSNSADDSLTVYSRNGVGTWFVAATPATGDAPMGLCATDIDGDGDTDIAVADSGSDTVSFFRGQSGSTITLAARTSHTTNDGPVDVDPWDPDNTKGGSQSLVTSNAGDNSMSFLVNNGSGFNAPARFDAAPGPLQVITGDLNLDGNADVATLNSSGTMTVFICDGAGSFLDGAIIPVGDNPLSFARADLDLDGDLDIAIVAENDSDVQTVKIFRNDTDPSDNNLTLASPSEVSTPTPQIVLTGTVDGDTRPDIITVGSGLRSTTTIASVANSSLCPSDFDRNSFVNGDDFDAFMVAFDQGDIASDFDHNGFVNGDDFDFFTYAFEQGC